MTVSAGDRLILLTDGIAETFDPQGNLFGRKTVRRYFFDHHADPPEELMSDLSRVLTEYREGHAARDDITMLAAAFTEQLRPASSPDEPSCSSAQRHRAMASVPGL